MTNVSVALACRQVEILRTHPVEHKRLVCDI